MRAGGIADGDEGQSQDNQYGLQVGIVMLMQGVN